MKKGLILFVAIVSLIQSSAQDITQTIRGVIRDKDSRTTLVGANIIVIGSDPIIGTSTDLDGLFTLENVPVGRVDLKITFLGYEEKIIPNLILGAGKQIVLDIDLAESLVKLDEAVVTAQKNKADVLNEMAMISARTFSVEETKRYAGSFNDPARMVSAFAGVTSDPEGDNNIIVRGNSPKGILWRLEGVEIPNPNHFSEEGTTGGPINALNSAMLSNSDFFTGAFAPEYGNATSGVFDMKLRNGNNEEREYSFSAGVVGIDLTAEGPFVKGRNSSYLVNYRYSSLAILDNLNIVDFQGIPKYQDGSFKLLFPTKNAGTFSVFGLGGKSNIYQSDQDADDETKIYADSDYKSHMGVAGINQTMAVGAHSYLKNSISFSTNGSGTDYRVLEGETMRLDYQDYLNKNTWRASTFYNTKLNSQHTLKVGASYSLYEYDFREKLFDEEKNEMIQRLNSDGESGMAQGFISWKYRINEDVTMVSGLHYMHFMLNNSNSIEPRVGVKWQFAEKQALSAGIGLHSKLESLTAYFAMKQQQNGSYELPNKDLELGKAAHFIIGYENMLSPNILFKAEAYYQHLYNVPVENDPASNYSILNSDGYFSNIDLINEGLGRNYGLELTLERYFHNNYFFLITGSLFESEYMTLNNEWRDSRFNSNFSSNILFGKELIVGNAAKNNTIGITGKVTYTGGQRYTPLDLQESIVKGHGVYHNEDAFTARADNLFMANVVIYYRKERPRTSHEIRIDVQNVTNNSAVLYEYYNSRTQEINYGRQLPMIPMIYYKVDF